MKRAMAILKIQAKFLVCAKRATVVMEILLLFRQEAQAKKAVITTLSQIHGSAANKMIQAISHYKIWQMECI